MVCTAFVSLTPVSVSGSIARRPRITSIHRPWRDAQTTTMSLMSDIATRAKSDTALLLKHGGKALSVAALVLALTLPADQALAARGGGRVGGSSFRSPPVTRRVAPRAPPPGAYGGGYSGGYGYGFGGGFAMPGLFFNPFFVPVGGFGVGGGLGSFLIFATAAAFLYDTVQKRVESKEEEEAVNPTTAVTVLKVGLLANARALQLDLDMLARSANTASISGLRYVLDQTVTSLLRNPDYWMYGSVDVDRAPLSEAEGKFNRVCLEERLKLDEETLSNTAGRKAEATRASATRADLSKAPNEYIVISLVVAAAGDLITKMPKAIDSPNDVNRALRALAGVTADSLQGVEVIWAPQSLKDTLTEKEMLADHPELRRL